MNEKTLARALGWFSIGLGLIEVAGTDILAGALGMEKDKSLLRGYGFRELGAGVAILTQETPTAAPVWSRVAGDGLDIATLVVALKDNPKRANVGIALGAVAGVTILDVVCAVALGKE